MHTNVHHTSDIAPGPTYGERIVRLETELAEARADIRGLADKVDLLIAELHRIQGGKAVLWAVFGALGSLLSVGLGWLARKHGGS